MNEIPRPITEIGLLVADRIEAMLAYWDKDMICRFANHAYLDWFGKKKEEMVGKITMQELLGPLFEKNLPYITEVLKGNAQQFERDITTPAGETRNSLANYYPDNHNGEVKGFFVHVADITKQKKTEEQLLMMKVLSAQNIQLNDFCGIVSHNLRGPLINLSILSDFISECEDLEEREVMFRKIKPIVASLSETFDNLVESLQVREEIGLTFEKNNFEELTQKILQKYAIEIDLYNISISLDFSAAEQVFYPKKYLESIVSNLISNAIKYRSTSRSPTIHIKTERDGDCISLKVIDNGLGIDLKRNAQHLFKMRKVFHDHPEAKGYGLFMTKTQVDAMEGHIHAESAPDQGTTFIIKFNIKNTCT